jgi:glutamyl-tRNA synthetase/glutamyl-Q tRNA(Asp) synthetase
MIGLGSGTNARNHEKDAGRTGVIISRFAPAPTGFLHLGHVVNAVYVWGVTRALDGRVLVRIEDHDRVRSRPAYEAAILEDLAWLGFHGDGPVTRQRERGDIYLQALESLRRQGLVYACACSRADVERSADRQASDHELRYSGACRHRGLPESSGAGIRIRLDPGTERFVDWRHGPQEQRPFAQCGDLLARDRDGNWTYQFAATVDDLTQDVTLVIRGDDLLASTGRQIQLARLLGRRTPPEFLHHALVMKTSTHTAANARGVLSAADGQKLSKSDRDTGVRDLRARGWTAARVVGEACTVAGLIAAPRDVAADEVSSMMGAFKGVPR